MSYHSPFLLLSYISFPSLASLLFPVMICVAGALNVIDETVFVRKEMGGKI
jgi:hypothetical protein